MKRLILLFVALSALCVARAQQGTSIYGDDVKVDVKMKYVYSFEEALNKAEKENKLIFFNCFADWALPCHAMNFHVFSNQEFADWCDDKFVNLFIDVTKGEGEMLAKKYNIITFSQYLVLDSKGEIVQRIVGSDSIPNFKPMLERALNPKTSYRYLKTKYDSGARDVNTLRNYARALFAAGEGEKATEVSNQMVKKLKPAQLAKEENWYLLMRTAFPYDGELFRTIIENRERFVKNNGLENVNRLISLNYTNELGPFITSGVYDKSKLLDFYLEMKNSGLPLDDIAYNMYEVVKLRSNGDVKGVIDYVKSNGKDWDPSIPYLINMNLPSIENLDEKDKELISDYLLELADTLHESQANKYRSIVARMMNQTGIRFEKGSFSDALAKAKESGRPIFLDCYTNWCGPCIQMANNVFTQEGVGDFFNKNFINLKMNMEQGEGVELAKRYNVKAYPTMLLINAKGEVFHTVVGGRDAQTLVNDMKKGLDNLYKKR